MAQSLLVDNTAAQLCSDFFCTMWFCVGRCRAVSVSLLLDNCQLRFIPARNLPWPDSELGAMKIRFSYPSDPLIRLESNVCSGEPLPPLSSVTLRNGRSRSV
eukprot:1797227-Rhodomonas_salina.1